jgi:hypothetical protein
VPPVLFRFVSPASAGFNGRDKIRASRFGTLLHRPAPRSVDAENLLYDAELHMARHHVASSLISTSDMLTWAFSMYFRNDIDNESKWLYFINGQSANKHTRIFHAAPLLRELRGRGRFAAKDIRTAQDNSAALVHCKYRGKSEFLVYGEISAQSIIRVVSVSDILELSDKYPSVKLLLRLRLFQHARNHAAIRKEMTKDQILFDQSMGKAIALLMLLFGMTPDTAEDLLDSIFYQLIDGWRLKIPTNHAARLNAIQAFITTFCSGSGKPINNATTEKLEQIGIKALTSWVSRRYYPWPSG